MGSNGEIEMRLIRFLITLLIFGLACDGAILDTTPSNSINSENFFETPEDAIAALNGAYQTLQWPNNYNFRLWTLDIVAGNAEVGAGGGEDGLETKQLAAFLVETDNPGVEDLWRGIWPAVAKSNFVISRVNTMDNINNILRERIIAEAKFLRALHYFNGVRLFGALPIITEPASDDLFVTRTTVEETYNLIISDLIDAVAVLPDKYSGSTNNEVGRATRGAALGLLAKVYLTIGDYELAETTALEVTGLGYDLNQNYWQNFDPFSENDIESLFEVQFSSAAGYDPFDKKHQGSWAPEFTNPRGSGISPGGGYGWGHVTQEFVDSYESNDDRKSVTVWMPGDTYGSYTYDPTFSSTGYNIKKWVRGSESITGTDSDLNMPVLRYADILLILAEAVNEQDRPGDAETYINDVRNRAGLLNISGLNQEQMRQRILQERRVEFAFEGQWWFDIMRQGPDDAERYFFALGKTNFDKTKHILFPIPQTDIDLNPNMEQNPNY